MISGCNNSIVYEIVAAGIEIVSCSITAYGMARFDFRIKPILNVFLNYFTIAILGMGVDGAAVSTVLSQLVSCILCVIYIKM